ncbi:hypothetical protein JMJ77_0007665, partial [Colletotrichum scovillei]
AQTDPILLIVSSSISANPCYCGVICGNLECLVRMKRRRDEFEPGPCCHRLLFSCVERHLIQSPLRSLARPSLRVGALKRPSTTFGLFSRQAEIRQVCFFFPFLFAEHCILTRSRRRAKPCFKPVAEFCG